MYEPMILTLMTGFFLLHSYLPGQWVKKSGTVVNIELRPHDLCRHAATYASRSGTPIEIVSKAIFAAYRSFNDSTVYREGE
jgi:hypothetical protein